MHALVWHSLRPKSTVSLRSCGRVPCALWATNNAQRSFHASSATNRDPKDPSETDNPAWVAEAGKETASAVNKTGGESEGADREQTTDNGSDRNQRARERNNAYGSAARRSARGRRLKELPPVEIPNWFFERNVKLVEEKWEGDKLEIVKKPERKPGPPKKLSLDEVTTPGSDCRYRIDIGVWNEILSALRAGLSVPVQRHSESFPHFKSHLLLRSLDKGAIFFLDSILSKAATELEADLVRIDPQDIAEIVGDYLGEIPGPGSSRRSVPTLHSARSLSYDTYSEPSATTWRAVMEAPEERREQEEEDEEGEEEEGEEDEDEAGSHFPSQSHHITAVPVSSAFAERLRGVVANVFSGNMSGDGRGGSNNKGPQVDLDAWDDRKLNSVLACLCGARQLKRGLPDLAETSNSLEDASPDTSEVKGTAQSISESETSRPLIIAIRDFEELQELPFGRKALSLMNLLVWSRRKLGQEIVIVGTSSRHIVGPSVTKAAIDSFQAAHEDGYGRSIVVPPFSPSDLDVNFVEDAQRRTCEINLRNLSDVLRRRRPEWMDVSTFAQETQSPLDPGLVYQFDWGNRVWPFSRVHRVATTALGSLPRGEILTMKHICNTMELIGESDDTKRDMSSSARRHMGPKISIEEEEGDAKPKSVIPPIKRREKGSENKRKADNKSYNRHEKKLLGGVVNADSIKTTFQQVRAPPDTIEALKTLTTLSLIRPDAFKYGVLANDKIPGLLLYGPPGTGKTLLARAVAKESGASVLEVSGSDLYDMYVGEGEKNVKAVFTLAKKLSPCVVFIDEADAIFGSRSGNVNRTSHRELINQFLREWDGMDDLSAFIMVATNRPFDLDDAVLRRLPRRLLVDLPTEEDRKSILDIHLQGEALDAEVSLPDLAQRTPFYSGSDLKNVAVAAALACVREENELATKSGENPESYEYPTKRTLTSAHFNKALEEISASISEDMSSLAAIRKFDEKYGDRRGRKKKRSGWGFGEVAKEDQQRETGRVRN
ncbi:MAG: hypothetical protein M4579_001936 [Chaenotheca gracillima]|nr:MAG: hypothetical protein M4579_001936 [Chaenotheca gracillima]